MEKRLYRSRTDTMVGGVCGGLAKYFDVDPVIVRIAFVALALANGAGVLIYIIMWLIVPLEGAPTEAGAPETIKSGAQEMADKAREMGTTAGEAAKDLGASVQQAAEKHGPDTGAVIAGIVLVVLGVTFLARNLGFWFFDWLDARILWPGVLIALGFVLLFRRTKGE